MTTSTIGTPDVPPIHRVTVDGEQRYAVPGMTDRNMTAFLAKYRPSVGGGCWEWTGGRTVKSYGTIRIGNGSQGAHRVALMLKIGRPLASGEVAMHSCDNPPCVNPAHLSVGTASDNASDMVTKDRQGPQMRPSPTCAQGHDLTLPGARRKPAGNNTVGNCAACERAAKTAKRRAAGAKPRQFRNREMA